MLAIALAIKLDSKGPVLFRQPRHGFNNRVMTLVKFRTMQAHPERVTRVGRFLRSTSLDELPQLFHVLRGDMSLVGPRPHEIDKTTGERPYHHIVADYAHRHRVRPGITGWAQVNGCRGAIKTPASLRRRHRLDLDYIAHASLWLDMQILARTASILFMDLRAALGAKLSRK
jgi:lipopolysaccharide/colanic/teichoic acid biosynthesis glycosyltransferase